MEWLACYESNNAAIRRLQFISIGYNFIVIHRPDFPNEDDDALSRLGVNATICQHIASVYSNNAALDTYY